MSNSIYCPICGRDIEPDNEQEVLDGEESGFVYVHDDVIHTEEDLKALESGVQ